MSDQNIRDFGSGWLQMGVLMFCLISFATTFFVFNNPMGLGEEAAEQLGITGNNLSSTIFQITDDTDILLNITANTNPTEGFLGSRDSVATSYGITDIASGFFTSMKTFLSWIFFGVVGQMLLFLFGGLFSLFGLYYIIKFLRTGT